MFRTDNQFNFNLLKTVDLFSVLSQCQEEECSVCQWEQYILRSWMECSLECSQVQLEMGAI